MIWELFVGVIIIYGLVFRWKARHRIKFAKKFKSSIKSYPVLGHSVWFIKCKTDKDRWDLLEMFARDTLKQGGITASWNLHRFFMLIADPEVAECVMKQCLEKDDSMKLALSLAGNGSAIAEVPIWRPRRKILVPSFSQKHLLNFSEVFSRQSTILLEQLQKVAGTGSFPLFEYIYAYAVDVICETALGTTVNAQRDPHQKLLGAFSGTCGLISDRIVKPWLHFGPIYQLTANYKQFMGYMETINSFIDGVIQKTRKELAENKNANKVQEENRFKTFLELMIETSGGDNGYSNIELREETIVLFTAGTDTSSVGSCFTCILLARHPDIQEKVYQELREVFGDSNRPVTADDLTRLKYLDAVIKESLRLYPPAPMLLRKVDQDVLLPSGDTLPKDTGVILSVFATQRNPRYWGDDAELFRPERFIDSRPSHPAAFLAFSNGPRNCIGYGFGMMSMKSVLATILRQFKLLPVSNQDLGKPIDLKFDIMLRAVDEFQVILERRS